MKKFSISRLSRFFNSRIMVSWAASYLVIFSVPVLTNMYVYHMAESTIENQLYESESRMLDTLQRSMDETITGLSAFVPMLERSAAINSIIAQGGDNAGYIPLIPPLAKYLASFKSPYNTTIHDVYLYFHTLDIGVATNYCDKASRFFDYYYAGSDAEYSTWYDNMRKNSYAAYMVVDNGTDGKYLDFTYSIPANSMGSADATVVIRVDQELFGKRIRDSNSPDEKSFFIIDESGRTVMSYGDGPAEGIRFDEYGAGRSVTKDKKNIIISHISELNNWRYFAVIPKSVISGQLKYLNTLTFINYLICLLVGSVLVYYFTAKNYRPINKLMTICKNTPYHIASKNEYEVINSIVQDYVDTKRQFKTIQYVQESNKKNLLLKNLLRGNLDRYANVEKEMGKVDVKFISDYFGVIVFKITKLEALWNDDERMDNGDKASMVCFIMTNVIEELAARSHKGHVTEAGGQIVCIISFDTANLADWQSDMAAVINEAKSFIESNFEFSFTASMSNIHQGLSGIAEAYSEARQTMRYRSLLKNNDLVFFEDISGGTRMGGTSEQGRQLVSFIRIGNEKTALSIIGGITAELFQSPDLNYIRLMIYNLTNSVLSALCGEDGSADNMDYQTLYSYINEIGSFKSPEDFQQKLEEFVVYACGVIRQRKTAAEEAGKIRTSSTDDLVENIKHYIEKNYHSNDLNIASIGDFFDITPYYASNMFKKAEGVSMLDYIGKTRVTAAKKIIEEDCRKPLASVAYEVGFNNVRTFLRTFSKYEGITPGQYKELAQHKPNHG